MALYHRYGKSTTLREFLLDFGTDPGLVARGKPPGFPHGLARGSSVKPECSGSWPIGQGGLVQHWNI